MASPAAIGEPLDGDVKTQKVYLSGKGINDAVLWDFMCTDGMNSGQWSKIPVPYNWEFRGFGQFTYGTVPEDKRLNESGIYRTSFYAPKEWKGQSIGIVFCGVMTDATVTLNGKSAGEVHRGAFYQFGYDISGLTLYGKDNLLEVRVDKSSADESVERSERNADFWVFGGIFRPVYIEVKPQRNISRIAIDAKADGSFNADVVVNGKTDGCSVKATVRDQDGNVFGETMESSVCEAGEEGETVMKLCGEFKSPKLWSSEFPNMYSVEVSLAKGGRVIHKVSEKFGFRTIEFKTREGIFVNGEKIHLKGVCRHSFWPESGRALSDSINLLDVTLIKQMNMNAVRMSHYPPDGRFLEICDSLGLYVLDELAGWHAYYTTETGRKLVREMIARDVNHPSVIIWDNGNESGFNFDLVSDFAKWDIQKRTVIHPWREEDHVNVSHYPTWDETVNHLEKRKIFFPTEFIHGLYDGGHGAGLEDYWNEIRRSPTGVGGFLWDLVDQAVLRNDRGNSFDTNGNQGADGILGPYREKEGSFFTIRDIWSPVQFENLSHIPSSFSGRLSVENDYTFTNLKECRFCVIYKRFDFAENISDSVAFDIESPDIAPGERRYLTVPVPENIRTYDCMQINVTDRYGYRIKEWSRTIRSAEEYATALLEKGKSDCEGLVEDGKLLGLKTGGDILLIDGGLRFACDAGNKSTIEMKNISSGWLEVSYEIRGNGSYDNIGITFSYPEEKILGMRWIGNGPYRVWKNRLRGVTFGMWEKKANDTKTGETWDYPEFRGYHSEMYASDIITTEGILRIAYASDDMFLHILTPSKHASSEGNIGGIFPDGQISILSRISPVGSKFTPASKLGPHGLKNIISGHENGSVKGHFYMKYIPK